LSPLYERHVSDITEERIVDYMFVDADNHYYEAEDAFFRHGDEDVKRYVRWVSEGKRRYMVFGTTMIGLANTSVPNPTFDPIAKPGAFHARLKELQDRTSGVTGLPLTDMHKAYGQLEHIPEGYRVNHARIDMIDEQNVERCLLFPTLGDCVEGLMHDNVPMAYKVFHAFNLWLEEDWGYAYRDRLYAPPYIPMLDPDLAAAELEYLLGKGVKAISLRPGPANGRSPADPAWDRFWSLMNESGTLAAYHGYGGTTRYSEAFDRMWGQSKADEGYDAALGQALTSDRGILETTVALVLGNLFGRFPNVRIASIELGCAWTPYALHMVDHAGSLLERRITAFGQTMQDLPSDVFKEHIYISPFPEEDVVGLTELIGVDRVLMGSDWPHPEGNIMPGDFADSIQKLPEAGIKKIMRDNLLALLQ
jgi:predicted TIM-barrel fold metal-dependent hydrolase